eukprot:gnl/Hemi2/14393_TR4870_c0_g1_i1.p1 gnl/Hemi2/14393_TR4870_c0_g1~~gnl/Hemi2/14393_TR4870_c0_g1_i1.p1  ORF type:complete len:290 (+),score=88.90 gnl/Hemi2/14393_TR4870_c0_g1_i1:158-1027(+)
MSSSTGSSASSRGLSAYPDAAYHPVATLASGSSNFDVSSVSPASVDLARNPPTPPVGQLDPSTGQAVLHGCQWDRENTVAQQLWLSNCVICCAAPYLCPFVAATQSCLKQSIEDEVASRRLYITKNFLIYRYGGHPLLCRVESCGCYRPLTERSIPIDRVQDIHVQEPSRGCLNGYCPVWNLQVQTAGVTVDKEGRVRFEVETKGVQDPAAFRSAVLRQTLLLRTGGDVGAPSGEPGCGTLAPPSTAAAYQTPPALAAMSGPAGSPTQQLVSEVGAIRSILARLASLLD